MMATNDRTELLLLLQQFQTDYYTKGNALKVHILLQQFISKINFDNYFLFKEFEKRHQQLKQIELISDLDNYAELFAENLLKLILLLKNCKTEEL
ncbi:hypothetical protein [Maribacter dokdonensis]|uniref:hypothetical protein n=1 Tax=Maribacter dokdonensis TaxID=320912 RepID=UPI0027372915|nr:hypothetical protein [Maribacter dokdonensis]MDP2527311.1 hypothetical protein [Maribacter dokdonensis]